MLGYIQLFIPDGKMAEQYSPARSNSTRRINSLATNLLTAQSCYKAGPKKQKRNTRNGRLYLLMRKTVLLTGTHFLDDLKKMEEQNVQGIDFAQVRAWLEEKIEQFASW